MIPFDENDGWLDDVMDVVRCVPRPEAQLASALYDLLWRD